VGVFLELDLWRSNLPGLGSTAPAWIGKKGRGVLRACSLTQRRAIRFAPFQYEQTSRAYAIGFI
jgi:hypothetical protein